jgi:enamine deaminase RidA (YjgF/YER057c/UK114 family)
MSTPSHTLTLSNPSGLYDPTANGYSHVAQVAASARLVFIAGQGGETADGELSTDFADQVGQALANLQVALRSVGAEVH